MKRLIAASLTLLLGSSAAMAEKVLKKVSWADLAKGGKLLNGQVQRTEPPDAFDALKLDNPDNQPKAATVLILDRPKISTRRYAIRGSVAYQNMTPGSHLETWSTFPDGQMCYSRGLAASGPLKHLGGTSDWRSFLLPFYSVEGLGSPMRIELNVVFAGGGSASLGPPELVEYSDDENPLPGFAPTSSFDQPLVRPRQVGQISWAELKAAGKLPAGQISRGEPPEPVEQLKIDHSEDAPETLAVAVIDRPGIAGLHYAVRGWVRHEQVAAGSYLELWSTFADGNRAFARTLADSGPMRRLDGSYQWRPFFLPFHSDQATGPPIRLEINVVFAGPGTVHLSPLRIEEYPAPSKPTPDPRPSPEGPPRPGSGDRPPQPPPASRQAGPTPKAWWDDRTSGLIGGIGGSILGCVGGLIGTLAGLGRARRLTLGLAGATIVFGLACLVAGTVAISLAQPYAVWYPLLLGGGISAGVMGSLLRTLRRRYAEIELRRMAAMDVHTGPN